MVNGKIEVKEDEILTIDQLSGTLPISQNKRITQERDDVLNNISHSLRCYHIAERGKAPCGALTNYCKTAT
jgi:hypothetical protein